MRDVAPQAAIELNWSRLRRRQRTFSISFSKGWLPPHRVHGEEIEHAEEVATTESNVFVHVRLAERKGRIRASRRCALVLRIVSDT